MPCLVEILKYVHQCFVTQAFVSVLESMFKLEQENPLAKSNVAQFAATAVYHGIITIAQLASPLTGGFLYPLFLLCLQQLAKAKDREWLVKVFRDSKVNLQNMLPGMYGPRQAGTRFWEGESAFSTALSNYFGLLLTILIALLLW